LPQRSLFIIHFELYIRFLVKHFFLLIVLSHRTIVSVISEHPVRVDFFVMSKCPDARKCEMLFLPVLMKLSSIVNVTLSYIAYERKPFQTDCMHGANECLGNRQQLCVQDLQSQMDLMQFLYCQTNEYHLIPYNAEECHRKISNQKISWAQIQKCVDSNRSNELFYQALERTRLASAKKSCTIHLNGKLWCIHDGSWSQCSEGHDEISLLRAICSRYNRKDQVVQCTAIV
jgi:hypothetical protein